MAATPLRAILVFRLAGNLTALPLECVARIEPMAELARPPGLPSLLEGILNLAGAAVPVLRLDRLLQMHEHQKTGLYSMLVLLKEMPEGRIAIQVDRVSEIVSVSHSDLLPVSQEDSFNACSEAVVSLDGRRVHLLSPAKILLEKERTFLSEYRRIEQQRLQNWRPEAQ